MKIIKRNVPYSTIPFGYYQYFQNEFTTKINEQQVLLLKNSKNITNVDVKIVELVLEQTFMTERQLVKLSRIKKNPVTSNQIEKLIKARILNRFILSSNEAGRFSNKNEELVVYCVDIGGKFLLNQYSNVDVSNWHTTINLQDSGLVSKLLMNTEFYIKLKESLGDNLLHFKSSPILKINRERFIPSCEFTIKDGMIERYFIAQVARSEDYPTELRNVTEFYVELLETKSWMKYYFDSPNPPILFYITDDDNTASLIGKTMHNVSNNERYRLTTFKRIQKNLGDVGAFLKYEPELGKLIETKSSMFSYALNKRENPLL